VVKILDTSLPWKSGFNPASDRSCRGIGLAGWCVAGCERFASSAPRIGRGSPKNRLFPSYFNVRARRADAAVVKMTVTSRKGASAPNGFESREPQGSARKGMDSIVGSPPILFAGGEEICCIDNRKVGGSTPPGRLHASPWLSGRASDSPQGVKQSRMFPGVHRDPW
jgi:hypothetical protein